MGIQFELSKEFQGEGGGVNMKASGTKLSFTMHSVDL